MNRSLFAVGLGLSQTLGACAVFEPAFPPPVVGAMSSGFDGVTELVAAVELGQFANPTSYSKSADRYASALGQLAIVDAWVESRSAQDDGRPASRAASLLGERVGTCIANLRGMAALHREEGLGPNEGLASVRVSCAIPFNNIVN